MATRTDTHGSRPPEGRERTADLVVHAAGVPLGVVGAAALVALVLARQAPDPTTLVSVGLYAAALVAMLGLSAAYNLAREPVRRARLRRLDHATIFVMIAGTYTPFMLVQVGGGWGAGFTAFVWAVALAGAAIKILLPGRLERASIALYLLLGWSVVMTLDSLVESVARANLLLLLAGGVVYTAGVGIYVWRSLPYHRALWHACVLAAAVLHYAAVARSML